MTILKRIERLEKKVATLEKQLQEQPKKASVLLDGKVIFQRENHD